jgi:hypothetical protein
MGYGRRYEQKTWGERKGTMEAPQYVTQRGDGAKTVGAWRRKTGKVTRKDRRVGRGREWAVAQDNEGMGGGQRRTRKSMRERARICGGGQRGTGKVGKRRKRGMRDETRAEGKGGISWNGKFERWEGKREEDGWKTQGARGRREIKT